jgi:hypothetical protein
VFGFRADLLAAMVWCDGDNHPAGGGQ